MKKLFHIFVVLGLAAGICGLLLIFSPKSFNPLPSFQDVQASYQKSDALLLDRHGTVIHELRVDATARRLDWTSLKEISPALLSAVIRSEDKRFSQHRGVDWLAIGSAVLSRFGSGTPRGASTITMQLASLMDDALKPRKVRRSLRQKWNQIRAARSIEGRWTKDEILEAYVNLVSFRGELQGIAAASKGLFDKEPGGLNRAESLVLASLVRSPNASAEAVAKRACRLSTSLAWNTGCDDTRALAQSRFSRAYAVRQRVSIAPHVALKVLRQDGSNMHSTLDGDLQRYATDVLERAVGVLSDQNVRDGAVLVVENRTGDVLAYVGNTGTLSSARYVDGVRARRQAGSTLKPFLYGLAFEKRILTAASLLSDSPLDVPTGRGIYEPKNYDHAFRGMISARTALASSVNIPAVRTVSLVGVEPFVRQLRSLGFRDLDEEQFYGHSLALGSADVSLWDLVNAYRTLARSGASSELRLTLGRKDSEQGGTRILSSGAAFIVSDILSDREARSATFSLENPLATRFWSAVKTGTSKDMRDNWCVGYSNTYTVGVWVGNFSGSSMWNVSGMSGAAPVWFEVMNYLHRAVPSKPPEPPRDVIAQYVTFPEQFGLSGKQEWFIRGTEMEAVKQERRAYNTKILYPSSGTIIALDPDIPEGQQKIFFESTSDTSGMTWMLDGIVLGQGQALSWTPSPGSHRLSLVRNGDHIMDEIAFEVR
ncbi:MAG TPA: penicillin-binding protein 1C [Nitrospiraceae bacterium]|nr:penicillin-binding protein 1C [Nitrospiraceae bacterium]